MTTQSTTEINACDASVWLDSHAGTPKEISGSSNEVNMKFSTDIGETKNFRNRGRQRIACGQDAEFGLVVTYSTANDEAVDLLKEWYFEYPSEKRTLSVYLPDKNVGADMYTGEFVLKDLSIPAKSDDPNPIMVSATLLPNGLVDLVTNAT